MTTFCVPFSTVSVVENADDECQCLATRTIIFVISSDYCFTLPRKSICSFSTPPSPSLSVSSLILCNLLFSHRWMNYCWNLFKSMQKYLSLTKKKNAIFWCFTRDFLVQWLCSAERSTTIARRLTRIIFKFSAISFCIWKIKSNFGWRSIEIATEKIFWWFWRLHEKIKWRIFMTTFAWTDASECVRWNEWTRIF